MGFGINNDLKDLKCSILIYSGTTFSRITFHSWFLLSWSYNTFGMRDRRQKWSSKCLIFNTQKVSVGYKVLCSTYILFLVSRFTLVVWGNSWAKESWFPDKVLPSSLTPWSGVYFTMWWMATKNHLLRTLPVLTLELWRWWDNQRFQFILVGFNCSYFHHIMCVLCSQILTPNTNNNFT